MPNGDSVAIKNHAAFIWSVADLLSGDYKQSECGKVILPFTVLRRLDCVLEPSKAKVLETHTKMKGKVENLDPILEKTSPHRARRNRRGGPSPLARSHLPMRVSLDSRPAMCHGRAVHRRTSCERTSGT